MGTEITVRGAHSMFRAPERATVQATISHEGAEGRSVYERVATNLEAVKASIAPLVDLGAVTSWSADQLRTWSNRPRKQDGTSLPLVYYARAALGVEFGDISALSEWVSAHAAGTEGFQLASVDWALTDEHRDELLHDARRRAVLDAATRARQYADALGLGAVSPVSVTELEVLAHGPGPVRLAAARHGADSGPVVELTPKDVEVSAAVDARFATDS